MNGEFVPVKTWQGFVMVSTSLLPQSFDEKTRIYPDSNPPSNLRVDALPLEHRNSQHMAVTLPPPPPAPVPDYWHHGAHAAVADTGFEFDVNFFHAKSSSISSTVSSYEQTCSPVYMPRMDDNTPSIPEAHSLFSPWESASEFFHHSPVEWGDSVVATGSSLFPVAEDYCSVPAIDMPGQAGPDLIEQNKAARLGQFTYFTLPTSSTECRGGIETQRMEPGQNF